MPLYGMNAYIKMYMKKREDGFRLDVINASIEPVRKESGKDEQIRFEYYMKLYLFSLFIFF